jgi:hypothetical protein
MEQRPGERPGAARDEPENARQEDLARTVAAVMRPAAVGSPPRRTDRGAGHGARVVPDVRFLTSTTPSTLSDRRTARRDEALPRHGAAERAPAVGDLDGDRAGIQAEGTGQDVRGDLLGAPAAGPAARSPSGRRTESSGT